MRVSIEANSSAYDQSFYEERIRDGPQRAELMGREGGGRERDEKITDRDFEV